MKEWPVDPSISRATALALAIVALVCPLRPAWSQQPAAAGLASLTGTVDDSIRGRPLAGALVTVPGTTRQATTDAAGMFSIDSITPGPHSILVTHPFLDTLGLQIHSATFTLAAGDRLQLNVHTPSIDDLREGSCARGGVAAGSSMLVGRVNKADSDEPGRRRDAFHSSSAISTPSTVPSVCGTAARMPPACSLSVACHRSSLEAFRLPWADSRRRTFQSR